MLFRYIFAFSQGYIYILIGRQPFLVHCASFFGFRTALIDLPWRLASWTGRTYAGGGSHRSLLTCLATRSAAYLREACPHQKLGRPIRPQMASSWDCTSTCRRPSLHFHVFATWLLLGIDIPLPYNHGVYPVMG